MADPASWLAVGSMGASLIGGVMGADSAMAGGRSSQKMAMFRAALAQRNAQIAENNAQYSIIEGEQTASRYGMGARQRAGQIIAGQGASGLDVGSGSARDVQKSQETVTRLDMAQIRQNAAKVAYNYRLESRNDQLEAMGAMVAGDNAMKAARSSAAASILGGATSVADKWLKQKEMGGFNFGLGGV